MNEMRIPPHSLDAEVSVLGSMMLDSSTIPEVAAMLTPEDFYVPAHQSLFRGMVHMSNHRMPVDIVLVKMALEKMGKLQAVGGIEYIASIAESVPSASNAKFYARIVKDKALLRHCIRLGTDMAARAYENPDDVVDMVKYYQQKVYELTLSQEDGRIMTAGQAARAAIHRAERVATGEEPAGISLGFPSIDKASGGGVKPGELIVVAGGTSTGKTSLSTSFAMNVAQNSNSVLMFSCEMSNEQVARRMLAILSGINALSIAKGTGLKPDDWTKLLAAQAEMDAWDNRFMLIDKPMTVIQMENEVRRAATRNGKPVDLVIVDYVQIVPGPEKDAKDRVSTASRNLLLMAKDLKCPVLLLSQLKRIQDHTGKARRPEKNDLKESGDLENNADAVILLHKPDPTGDESFMEYVNVEMKIAKYRNGMTTDWDGPGSIRLKFYPKYTKFEEVPQSYA